MARSAYRAVRRVCGLKGGAPMQGCTWCGRRVASRFVEMVLSDKHQARWYGSRVCKSCTDALVDMLDDASSKSGRRNHQLGWWEDKNFYPLAEPYQRVVRQPMVIVQVPDVDLEPPAAG